MIKRSKSNKAFDKIDIINLKIMSDFILKTILSIITLNIPKKNYTIQTRKRFYGFHHLPISKFKNYFSFLMTFLL